MVCKIAIKPLDTEGLGLVWLLLGVAGFVSAIVDMVGTM